VSLSFNSISESAISELPFGRPVADLEIELFGDNSFAFNLAATTANLVLGSANEEVTSVFYGGARDTWLIPLVAAASDQTQQIFNFVDTANLELSVSSTNIYRLNSVESTALTVLAPATSTTVYKIPEDTISLGLDIESTEQFSWVNTDPAPLLLEDRKSVV
jgi:hypothetical protein